MLEKLMNMNEKEGMAFLGSQGPKAVDAVSTLVEVGIDNEIKKVNGFIEQFVKEGELTEEEKAIVEKFKESLLGTSEAGKEFLALVFGKIKGWVTK